MEITWRTPGLGWQKRKQEELKQNKTEDYRKRGSRLIRKPFQEGFVECLVAMKCSGMVLT